MFELDHEWWSQHSPILENILVLYILSVFPIFIVRGKKATLNRPHLDFQVHFYVKFVIWTDQKSAWTRQFGLLPVLRENTAFYCSLLRFDFRSYFSSVSPAFSNYFLLCISVNCTFGIQISVRLVLHVLPHCRNNSIFQALQLHFVPVQSVSITIKVVSSNPVHGSVLDATLCDKVCQWLATGRWFSPVSSATIYIICNSNIVESGFKYHNPNPINKLFLKCTIIGIN